MIAKNKERFQKRIKNKQAHGMLTLCLFLVKTSTSCVSKRMVNVVDLTNKGELFLNDDDQKIKDILDSQIYYPEKYGFDIADSEMLMEYFLELSHQQKKKLYTIFPKSQHSYWDYFNMYWDDYKTNFWFGVLQLLSKRKKKEFIVCYEDCLDKIISDRLKNEKYDWGTFKCPLKDQGETMKLKMIEENWSDLGMQVYGCNSKTGLCPCLRTDTSGSAYKYFRKYLEQEGLQPDSMIPASLRYI